MFALAAAAAAAAALLAVVGANPPGGSRSLHDRMDMVFAWKYIDYVFPSPKIRQQLIDSGQFIFHRNMAVGFELWGDKFFVTTPRRKAGVPVVLGYVKVNDKDTSPLVTPYPDYETNRLPLPGEPEDAVHITTAYRIKVDACDRLWLVDTGRADVGQGHGLLSTPQILIYDLRSDTLLRRYFLRPDDYRRESSFFATITVEATPDRCDDAYAYLADLGAGGLVVYSLRDNRSWRVKHSYFGADPLSSNYDVDGLQFQLQDGVITATVSAQQNDGYRTVYFHALSSVNEFAVSTKILHNESIASKSHLAFMNLGRRGPNTQSTASFFDEKRGILFFSEVQTHSVTCWNTYRYPSMEGNIDLVATDKETKAFIYPCDIKVDRNDTLWVLSTNIPRYVFGDLNATEFNHFIFKTPVEKAIQGTKCYPKSVSSTSSSSVYFPQSQSSGRNKTGIRRPGMYRRYHNRR